MKKLYKKLLFASFIITTPVLQLGGEDAGLLQDINQPLNLQGQLSGSVMGAPFQSDMQQLESSLPVSADQPFSGENPQETHPVIEEKIEETPQQPQSVSAETVTPGSIKKKIESKEPEQQVYVDEKDVDHKEELKKQTVEIPAREPQLPEKPVVPPLEAAQQPQLEQRSVEQESALENEEQQDEELVFNFENADLSNLVSYIENFFSVKFITDEIVKPMLNTGKAVKGNKISFKTTKPLSRHQAWSLFLTFMDLAGLSIIPEAQPGLYRIMATPAAKKAALPSYIGIDAQLLPDNDSKIRYVYFVKDVPVDTLRNVVGAIKSPAAEILILQELKALIITDSSYNIKSLMEIVHELDKVSMPQAMSVLKLKRVDASHVKKLYDSLTRQDQNAQTGARLFAPRNSATTLYFPENMNMIVETRTNSLILLGTREAIQKMEEFIIKHIDVDPEMPYSPLHVIELKFADAAMVAEIMTNVSSFGQNVAAAGVGGVRGEDKYLKQMTFTPEQTGNRLIIRGDYDDFLKAKEIIDQIDAPQPQVAIEVLILSVDISDIKQLGTQLRNSPKLNADGTIKNEGLFGNKISMQTSGSYLGTNPPSSVVQNTNQSGVKRLLGDLVSLVTGSAAGNTILTLGSDAFGVWGIFNALKTISNVQVVSNPFLIATNKTEAVVSLGEIKNIVTATIETQNPVPTYSDKKADLTVKITPQINSDGMIVLKLNISIVAFETGTYATSVAARTTKVIETSTIMADKEVLALGGLIQNTIKNTASKVPVLGNLPVIGWLFKNKQKQASKSDLLVLISARILDPFSQKEADTFTQNHIGDYKSTIKQFDDEGLRRDPIDRAFFQEKKDSSEHVMDKFIFKRDVKTQEKKQAKRKSIIAGAEHEKNKRFKQAKKLKEKKKSKKAAYTPATQEQTLPEQKTTEAVLPPPPSAQQITNEERNAS
jgi:general secretion pathway protein D